MTKKTETFDFSMPLDFITRYNTKAFEQFKDSSSEVVSFLTKRLQEDMALSQKLANCKHPMDVMDIWADFYKTAFDDYFQQSTKMFNLMEKVTEETKAVVKDKAEAGEPVLEPVETAAA